MPTPEERRADTAGAGPEFVFFWKERDLDPRLPQPVVAGAVRGRRHDLRHRRVRGFSEDRWAAARYDIVVAGNVAKFSQNDELRRYLLSTGTRVLVEASPLDRVWGIGLAEDDQRARSPSRWRGKNLLGFALMEVRERLGSD